ncbi:aromatic ring-hydroxylating dioxygenase subunit alpha [Rhodophyticola sp. CCM32]|uniref:aromatic ring-hydroxylating oxygenase subunit alpha n=1 Tax=Rhodophyticola sp. CCM32 TaxID=2916397 RepID=UPI00107F3673|nr:aromatic ring-hydroxylating dioxygenase subunit alpha [Rhodophyticola sp. CCM32]QBY00324.1 aromatic ring-hydroxylating dioxygenase subunit alpha [Rhodophyticola sp. CCM32]
MDKTTTAAVDKIRDDLAQLQALDQKDARAMPGDYYGSEEFLEFEKENLFRKEWFCLGHIGELPNPGDFYTTDLIGELLLVTRDEDGEIRVLSNVCRHRGNQVVVEPKGNQKRFVCGYHAWTYGQDGALKAAPLMKKVRTFDQAKCGLKQFRTEIWENFIFVNLDGNATPLAPRMAGMSKLITNYHHELRHLVHMEEAVWDTNWKSLMENFLEGYHLSATHFKTLHPITPTKLCRKIEELGEGYTGYHSFYDEDWPDRGPFHEDLTDVERRNSVLGCAYPNLLFGIATHYTIFICLRPVSADKVAIRWGVAGFNPDPENEGTKEYVDLISEANEEDREKLVTLARAMKSKYYTPGPLAPDDFEGTIWDFTQYIAKHLAKAKDA